MSLGLALLICLGSAQQPAPAQRGAEVATLWWEQLDPALRDRYHERWLKYRESGTSSQEVLRKRFDAIEDERSLLYRRLTEEERTRFEAMDDVERRRFLDERLRERFRERAARWQGRAPGFAEGLRDLPPAECSRRLEGFARQMHSDRLRRELDEAVREGWIGPAAADWLRQAPADEVFTAVGQVHRWRFLERAHREGFWEAHRIDPEDRSRMLELPIPHFFEEVRRLERGEPLLAPPCDWRKSNGARHSRGERPPGPPER